MKLKYKIVIIMGIFMELFLVSAEFLSEEAKNDNKVFFIRIFACLIGMLISMLVVSIMHMKKHTPEKRVFVYANKNTFLLKWVNIPKTAITNERVELIDAEDEYRSQKMKQKSMKKAFIGRWITYIIILAAILVLFVLFGVYKITDNELIEMFLALALIITIPFAFAVIPLLIAFAPERVVFSEEKVDAIKKFDELDDDIQITDSKIYPKEMYLEVSANKKIVYALINKKRLYIIDGNKKYMNLKKKTLDDPENGNVKNAYIELFNLTNIDVYDIKDIDINKVMETIRDVALRDEEYKY